MITKHCIAYAGPPGNGLSVMTANGEPLKSGLNAKLLLEEFKALPESKRKPATLVPMEYDYHRRSFLPQGFLALKVYNRTFHLRDAKRELRRVEIISRRLSGPNSDFLWLTEAEWKSLVPKDPRSGAKAPVAAPIAKRFFAHLVDNTDWCTTRGFGEVRSSELTLTVAEVSSTRVQLDLRGFARLSNAADAEKATHKGEFSFLGSLSYDRTKQVIDRLDVVALGDGRSPPYKDVHFKEDWQTLGVSFELSKPGTPGHGLLPGAFYFGLPLDGARQTVVTHAPPYFGALSPADRKRFEEYCKSRPGPAPSDR